MTALLYFQYFNRVILPQQTLNPLALTKPDSFGRKSAVDVQNLTGDVCAGIRT